MKKILVIHQSAELYGSDKTLLMLLENLDPAEFKAIVVVPFAGPLKDALENKGIEVVVAPVLKLYRKMFSPSNLLKFAADVRTGFRILDRLHKKHRFDFVYSNTLAVLLGLVFARCRNLTHLWHVHEIIESPSLFRKLFCRLLQLNANTCIVYNSRATANFWNVNDKIRRKSEIIANGVEDFSVSEDITALRQAHIGADAADVVIALVGRISRWKGQGVLLEAFDSLYQRHQNIRLLFVGSPPPNQEKFLRDLESAISQKKLSNAVRILPFAENIAEIWRAIDIAVVPSTEPEPFGLVAIEAMMAAKPVVASAHGGLLEIVQDGLTGYLVAPSEVVPLANALETLISDKDRRGKMGDAGRQRALSEFSVSKYVDLFKSVFNRL